MNSAVSFRLYIYSDILISDSLSSVCRFISNYSIISWGDYNDSSSVLVLFILIDYWLAH